ncbi:MAG: SRPBCC domain-containing protein [Granulosicoccus sp.]
MSTTIINKTIFIDAPKETVWDYLTDKNKLGEWFHPATENLEEGKPYTLLGDANDTSTRMCWGDVLKAIKPLQLSYTFKIKPLGDAVTTVHWTLEDAAGGTRVTLLHEGIGEAAGDAALGLLMALDKGWDEHFGKLRGIGAA